MILSIPWQWYICHNSNLYTLVYLSSGNYLTSISITTGGISAISKFSASRSTISALVPITGVCSISATALVVMTMSGSQLPLRENLICLFLELLRMVAGSQLSHSTSKNVGMTFQNGVCNLGPKRAKRRKYMRGPL